MSGLRLTAEVRTSLLGALSVYGTAGWTPNLTHLGLRKDVSTISIETGLVIEPLPFVSLRAGYRYHITDYTDSTTGSGRQEVIDGLHFGGGFHW